MTGSYSHTVDAKGRVFVPAKFRDALTRQFRMTCGPEGCIRAYTAAEWQKVEDAFEHAAVGDNRAKRALYRNVSEIDMDAQGRILIPEKLRDKAGITDKVEIIGMGGWAELWDPARLEAYQGDMTDDELFESFKGLSLS